ncbi:MAG: HD domain-containing protein [Bryobacteraceae bacterium]|nr:HD domain-containing protein [Bryobacteraceae bacterium]
MTDLHLVTKAAHYAAQAHAEHRRKNIEATPYINHLAEVAELLASAGLPAFVVAAGYLHDTIEDVEVTYEMLHTEFGVAIADLVLSVTDEKHLPRHARKERQVEHAAIASPETAAIKFADKISNLRSMVKSPPHGWNGARVQEYVTWAHRVVSRLPAPNAYLVLRYEETRLLLGHLVS